LPCRWLVAGICCHVLTGSVAARASTYFVATGGNDRNAGTAERPFRTVQRGLDAARPGDTVRVRPGTYRQRVSFPRGGEKGRPITLAGEWGAVIDGGDVFQGWEKAPEIGPGVFKRRAPIPYFPRLVSWNGKAIMVLRPEAQPFQSGEEKLAEYLAWPAQGRGTMADQYPLANWWDGIQAFYTRVGNVDTLRFQDGRDPDAEPMAFAEEGSAAILAEKKDYVVIRGLTVRDATYGIMVSGSDCVIEDNFVTTTGKSNILINKGGARNHIRWNELTYGYVYPDYGHPWREPVAHHIWTVLKGRSYGDEMGVRLDGHGDGNQVYGNHVFRHFDGITQKDGGGYTRVYNNILENIGDDALAPEGTEIECHWNDNLVIEGGNGCMTVYEDLANRIKRGPMYVYRNRFHFTQATNTGDSLHFKNPFPPETATLFFYHNSFCGNISSISVNGNFKGVPTSRNVYFLNNVFSSATFYSDCYPPQGGVGYLDYNWCGGQGADALAGKPTFGAHNIVANGARMWANPLAPDFLLPADSAARGRGVDVSKPFRLFGKEFPPLPGFRAGYFNGTAPDLGAIQYGEKPPIPAAPTDLSVKHVDGQAHLTWKDHADNETHFLIDRSEDGKVFGGVGRVPSNTTRFVDEGPDAARCAYRVRAINVKDGAWVSAFSNVATGK
jgi:hypothetical protein